MGLILISEIFEGGENRIGRCRAQGAERGIHKVFSQLFECVQVLFLPFSGAYAIQNLEHAPDSFAAGHAFSAGFPL